MADSFVQVPPDGSGKQIDTELIGGSVHRERVQIGGAALADIAGCTNTDPTGSEPALYVQQLVTKSPQKNATSSTALAAGSSDDLDSTQIGGGNTGKLLRASASGSVPFKAQLVVVADAIETVIETHYSNGAAGSFVWESPAREFVKVAQSAAAGFDGFRMKVTNLDAARSADFHASFFWDEV